MGGRSNMLLLPEPDGLEAEDAAAAAGAASDEDDELELLGLRLRVWMPSLRMASGRLTPCSLW